MNIKKLDRLFAECENRAYQCEINFNQNMGLQINISTKYLKGGKLRGNYVLLYHDDLINSMKKLIKDAFLWLEQDEYRKKEETAKANFMLYNFKKGES